MQCHEESLVLDPGSHDPGGLRPEVPNEEDQPVPVVLRDGVAVDVAVRVHYLQAVVPGVGDSVHANLGGRGTTFFNLGFCGNAAESSYTFSRRSSRFLPEMMATWTSAMFARRSRLFLLSGQMKASSGVLARPERVPSKSRITPSLELI